ncbi:MAG: PspC domain-containing protein [Pseudomonadales bacterium]|nr:PspC domain-containing protein [Candidatus Woesebacteria bacterium]MCB9801989.1 PspC domain-containing protein [Pseudomonadales bacterium]
MNEEIVISEGRARSPRRFVRPKEGRKIAGVAIGMANYFGVSVVLVRLIWALLLLPGGLPGLIPYIVCWFIIPSE